jgi:UPF0271 protein
VVERGLRLVTEGRVTAITGETIDVDADTICVHGDTPGAVAMASSLRGAFDRAGLRVEPMGRWLVR